LLGIDWFGGKDFGLAGKIKKKRKGTKATECKNASPAFGNPAGSFDPRLALRPPLARGVPLSLQANLFK
jgi:hypothetical protein